MTMKHRSMHYLRSGLSVLLGAGATLGGSFLVSRLRSKQEVETRLDRLEQMLDDLGGAQAPPVSPSTVPQPPAGDLGATQPKLKKSPRKPGK